MMEKPLFWHQGLFLQPQHLQLNDLTAQSLLTPYHRYLKKNMTGTGALRIADSALNKYVFQILDGSFWFSDNTYIVLSENGEAESRNFRNIWIESDSGMMVYAGIRKVNRHDENVTVIKPGQTLNDITTRYYSEETNATINDLHQKGTPANVKQLSYMVRVFFEPELESLADYELLPIARIIRRGDEIILDRDYIPPCFMISASRELSAITREIVDKLAFKGRELAAYKKRRGIHTAEFGSRDMVYLLALRTFNRYLSRFFELEEDVTAHPKDYYSVIRQIAGELSSFSETFSVKGEGNDGVQYLKPYDHENIRGCFSGASELIGMLVDEITAGPDYIIELKRDEYEFKAFLKPDHFDSNYSYYLVIKTAQDAAEIVQAVESEVKLSSVNVMPMLIQKSLPGIRIDYLSIPPQELPRRSDCHYFRIDASGNYWNSIANEKAVIGYWESAPDDIEIEIMVVRRK